MNDLAAPDTPPAARLTAGCKLNLHLRITGRLDNGYHSLETLFYYLPAPYDTIDIVPGERDQGLRLFCPGFPQLENRENILARAYDLFARHTGLRPDINVTLHKNIPMGAGLGGGSADAAALLVWLNENGRPLPAREMIDLAARIGADVPFFVQVFAGRQERRAAWGRGIGEILTAVDVPEISGLHLLLIFSDSGVSTPWAYTAWDNLPARQAISDGFFANKDLTSSLAGDKNSLAQALSLYNSFEAVVFPQYPALRRVKERLLQDGATAALMSGSGATVFGLFRDADLARQSAAGFNGKNYKYMLQEL